MYHIVSVMFTLNNEVMFRMLVILVNKNNFTANLLKADFTTCYYISNEMDFNFRLSLEKVFTANSNSAGDGVRWRDDTTVWIHSVISGRIDYNIIDFCVSTVFLYEALQSKESSVARKVTLMHIF